jgi:ATP:corrinoid adenosyltransferase
MVADGRGKFLRKALKSDKPIVIRCMIELYSIDYDYLSKEEAKNEYKNKPTDVKFVIPSTVPPLNGATQRLVERANTETKIKN